MPARSESLPDWHSYSIEELEEALAGLDRQRFPDRAARLEALIVERRDRPIAETEPETNFFEAVPDWESYDESELREALDGLDRRRFPEREQRIRQLLAERSDSRTARAAARTATSPSASSVRGDDLPLLPWGLTPGRVMSYFLAAAVALFAIIGMALEPVTIALALKNDNGAPIGSLLLLLLATIIAYWPHRRRTVSASKA